MNSFDDALWTSLETMRIAPAGAALSFEARLAREQGWSAGYTDRVMREYRRFLYLAATAPGQVTPSEAVDEAWHLHLSYTRHYWEELCANILRAPLHHDPTEGGTAELNRFRDQYAQTLALYAATFGETPPVSIWPTPDERFDVVARPVPWGRIGVVAFASSLLAACAVLTGNSGTADMDGRDTTLLIILGLFLGATILTAVRKGRKGVGGGGSGGCGGGSSSSDGGDSGCGGGCGGGD